MFKRLKQHLESSRKAQAVMAGYAIKLTTMVLGLLAFLYSWQADKVATSQELVKHIELFFQTLGNVTERVAALLAIGVMVEDAFHKLNLPWFSKAQQASADPLERSPGSSEEEARKR